MAAKSARPGRTLVAFFVGLAISYGLVALAGTWTPALGLDLQGGTRITMLAKEDPSAENLELARQIIDQRVNGSGINEAEVVSQGNNIIVVEVPGDTRRDLRDTVERQAQLRFRLVACIDDGSAACGSPAGTPQVPTEVPGEGVVAPSETAAPSDTPSDTPSGAPSDSDSASTDPSPSGTANRGPVRYQDELSLIHI